MSCLELSKTANIPPRRNLSTLNGWQWLGIVPLLLALGCGGGGGGNINFAGPKIMPMGDSITEGIDGNYRSLVAKDLESTFQFSFVGSLVDSSTDLRYRRHEGHGGWSIKNFIGEDTSAPAYPIGVALPASTWINNAQPEIILLLIGTNDGLCGIPEYARRYTKLLNLIYSVDPNVKIVLSQTLPRTADPKNLLMNQAHPGLLQAVANFPGKPIVVVDPSSGFVPTTMTVDGVHPNAIGNEILAKTMESGLQSLGVLTTPK